LKIQLPQDKEILVQVTPTDTTNLEELDNQQIRELYRQHGAILFRGFEVNIASFTKFTDRFCDRYVHNESPGREVLSQDGRVQTVNLGHLRFPLHPELSREPWQPDVAWFACEQANELQGETTICDGIDAAKAFSSEVLEHLKTNALLHQIPTTLRWCAQFFGRRELNLDQVMALSNPELFEFALINGELNRCYTRPMLHKPMFSDEWAYGNFLVFARRGLRVRHFPCYPDGNEVPDELVDEIEKITNELAHEIKWQKQDLLMLDNTRIMHGRNPIGDPENRRILTQFGYLSFAPDNWALGNLR